MWGICFRFSENAASVKKDRHKGTSSEKERDSFLRSFYQKKDYFFCRCHTVSDYAELCDRIRLGNRVRWEFAGKWWRAVRFFRTGRYPLWHEKKQHQLWGEGKKAEGGISECHMDFNILWGDKALYRSQREWEIRACTHRNERNGYCCEWSGNNHIDYH